MSIRSCALGVTVITAVGIVLMTAVSSYPQRHGGWTHDPQARHERAHGSGHGMGDASGSLAAWLFAIANASAAISILFRWSGRKLTHGSRLRESIERANRWQKRRLMKLHYWVNPLALGVALVHFWQTECKSTMIPELGLAVMAIIFLLGLLITFRWSPPSMRSMVHRLHTSPISLIFLIVLLMVGHSMVE